MVGKLERNQCTELDRGKCGSEKRRAEQSEGRTKKRSSPTRLPGLISRILSCGGAVGRLSEW